MSRCKRCNSVMLSITGVTCICGEPIEYERYYPKDNEYPDDGRQGNVPRRRGIAPAPDKYGDLLTDIKRFCSKYSFPYSSFGRRFFNDPNLVYRLMNGANPREGTIKKLRAAMKEYESGGRTAA